MNYQSANYIDPTFGSFSRDFIINNYYLTVFGTKVSDDLYEIQYIKKRPYGQTRFYTEFLNLTQINDLLDNLSQKDLETENRWSIIDGIRLSKKSGDKNKK